MKQIALLICLIFSLQAFAERRHSIELTGAVKDKAIKTLSVEQLEKDFPNLAKAKYEWREEGQHEFQGVYLKDFVAKYAAEGVSKMKVIATNAYSQTLSSKDWDEWAGMLAFKEDGKVISTTNKGTFRVMYDFKKYEKDMAVSPILAANAVWQVNKIEFIK